MSRTKHHRGQRTRQSRYDLWSKRPFSGWSYSAENKRLTRRTERARKRKAIEDEIKLEELGGDQD